VRKARLSLLERASDVTTTRRKGRFTVIARVAGEPMRPEEWRATDSLLARLVALAYAADHPELFSPAVAQSEREPDSGPPAAAAAVAGAPPANAGGAEDWSAEHDSVNSQED